MKNRKKIICLIVFLLAMTAFPFRRASANGTCSCLYDDPALAVGANEVSRGTASSEEECKKNCCGDKCENGDDYKYTENKSSSSSSSSSSTSTSTSSYSYTPMEEIPGFGKPTNFPAYVSALYNFGLWTIGIAAMLMIMIGGYMYLTSAGNTASTGKAKGIIVDAIAGLILALASWIILHTINPDLINLPLDAGSYFLPSSSTSSNSPFSSQIRSGKCVPVTSGPCSVENLKKTCFGENAEKASSICNVESGGNETISSGVDKCKPGNEPASYGLFQINISANDVADVSCGANALAPMYTSKNHNCTPQSNFDNCVSAAKNAEKNIKEACKISNNGEKWNQWGANSKCHF